MCGVAGIVALEKAATAPRRDELARMTSALEHRGPDAAGLFVSGAAGLGHTRLSIIDLEGGKQPMTEPTRGWVLVYNGEVFNYVELRDELRARGRPFVTESDTEVVLQAWLEWGDDAFARFDGQFAIALWNVHTQRLVLARDRFGVRPLYTCEHDGRVYFASEVKAIFAADPTIPRGFDPAGIDQTFTFWGPVAPRTAFAAISEVRPGHVRSFDRMTGVRNERAWYSLSFPTPRAAFSIEESTARVASALERAVSLRMLRADVPVGAYLSGGLDSSLVVALAHRATPRFSTFSVRFADAEYDETEWQRLLAKELGTDHHEIVVDRDAIADAFPAVVRHAERPILRTAPAPMYLLAKEVHAAGIKVVVTGEGADEMFAGYDLFREAKVRRFWAKAPLSRVRPRLLARLYPYLARSPVAQQAMAEKFFGRDLDRARVPGFGHGTRWQSTSAVKRLFARDLRAALAGSNVIDELLATVPYDLTQSTSLAQDQWIEIATLLSSYLLSAQGDRMAMAHSVEGRFPFLDTDVVDLAARLPDAHKLHVLDEKHVLKRVARNLLPEAIVKRKKQPYRAPDALAFIGGRGYELARDVLSPAAVARAGVFEPNAIARLLDKCTMQAAAAGQLSNTDNMALVGALSTQLLHDALVHVPAPKSVDTPLELVEMSP